jgi:predicted adenine nucleotide alpha hydrolase (AANH) superfamily ATPase
MKVVLHICCGVCSAGAADSLIKNGHQVIGFFYNPNIYPVEEYEKRLATAKRAAKELGFPLEVPQYQPEDWFKKTESLKQEPEGGMRCRICFEMRLKKTYKYLLDCTADAFTTTLTISPRKSAAIVNRIGREIGGDRFLEKDFKKKEGYKYTLQLANQWSLYKQNYCGCLYSIR